MGTCSLPVGVSRDLQRKVHLIHTLKERYELEVKGSEDGVGGRDEENRRGGGVVGAGVVGGRVRRRGPQKNHSV